ncbi:hypothetical protein [Actinomadura chokoriensis]|uniref:hypothetical protein n=1 Tax=Actinomadura chokoriensis TaxID=454156 RepID=UPI0031F7CA63
MDLLGAGAGVERQILVVAWEGQRLDAEPLGQHPGRWLGTPSPEALRCRRREIITAESVAMAFRTTYRPEAARGTTVGYEVRMGDFTLRLQITDGTLTVGVGPHPAPDLVIERLTDQGVHALMTGAKGPRRCWPTGVSAWKATPRSSPILSKLSASDRDGAKPKAPARPLDGAPVAVDGS